MDIVRANIDRIGGTIDVSMAEAVEMRQQRDGRSCKRIFQRIAAARNDQIDRFGMALEDLDHLAIGISDEAKSVARDAGAFQGADDQPGQKRIRGERLFTAAQHHRVAGLQPSTPASTVTLGRDS